MSRIISFLMFFFMFLALILSLAGIQHIGFDNQYYDFIRYVTSRLSSWSVEIPNIPSIPKMNDVSGILVVINAIVTFFNGLISVLNILITILNYLIQAIQFLLTLIGCLFSYNWSGSDLPDFIPTITTLL